MRSRHMRHLNTRLGSAFVLAALVTGCGQGQASSVPTSISASPKAGKAPSASTQIYAFASGTTVGSTMTRIVSVPNLGTLAAACSVDGRLSSRFTLAPKATTSSVVVSASPGAQVRGTAVARSLSSPVGPAAPVEQSWQIAPISPATIEVATITVSAQPAPAAFGGKGCVVAAHAVVTTLPR